MYRNREWIKIHTTRKCCNFSFVFLTTYDKVYMPRPGRFLGRTPLPALASCLTIWLAFFFIRTLKFGGIILSRFYPIRSPALYEQRRISGYLTAEVERFMPLPRGLLVPFCVEIGSSVFKISCSRIWQRTDERTGRINCAFCRSWLAPDVQTLQQMRSCLCHDVVCSCSAGHRQVGVSQLDHVFQRRRRRRRQTRGKQCSILCTLWSHSGERQTIVFVFLLSRQLHYTG